MALSLLPTNTAEEVERSADPAAAAAVLSRMNETRPGSTGRLESDAGLRAATVAVSAASPHLGRLLVADARALDVLSDLEARPDIDGRTAVALARSKQLELLRIAARDLAGMDGLEAVGGSLAALADDILGASLRLAGPPGGGMAVIGMGKLGGRELNYASDIDVMFVGEGEHAARAVLDAVRHSWRVDVDLRPEGRNGPLTRSLDSYMAYWDRWAETWEFQALIKARPVAGDTALGHAFMDAACRRIWERPFGAEELRAVRDMKARTEGEVARRGLTARELKRGPGGIRDIEFAVQLLQLVHGRADGDLRSPTTLTALRELAAAGYVAGDDADALEAAYRFLRAAEHRLQLVEGQPVHAIPASPAARARLARVMGYRDDADAPAVSRFDEDLRCHQTTVRSIHERLFFRPLLEAFTARRPGGPADERGGTAGLGERAAAERLAAFGWSDARRTRQAVLELTRGFSRSSRLMQQLLPLLLDWLSEAPDPDLGLLGLRSLMAAGQHQRDQLIGLFRESPEGARRLCALLGTSSLFSRGFQRHPDLLAGLAAGRPFTPRSDAELSALAERTLAWRGGPDERRVGLRRLLGAEWLRVAAADVLGLNGEAATAAALTALAEATIRTALEEVHPTVGFAVIAMGRFGGAELSYASDLDVLLVFDGDGSGDAVAAEAVAEAFLRYLNGETPATRVWPIDVNLRPEGRQGPLSRSVAAYAAYYDRWAQVWERQALLRSRFVAGDVAVGDRFAEAVARFLWGAPLTEAERQEIVRMKARIERERIPAGEDPQFHLKLGRGSLSDVEWTVQLLQLQQGISGQGTMAALAALESAGAIRPEDARLLADSYRFCEATRSRLYLVRGAPGDSLPATGPVLTRLARSLGTTPSGLREEYRRRTRRCRQVVERLFYGREASPAGPAALRRRPTPA